MESLDITIKKIVFSKPNANNPSGIPFIIAKTTSGQSVKGEMRKPVEFQAYRLWGEWRPQKNYEPAFVFSHYEPIIEQSSGGFADYLSTFVDGLGPVRSRAIVEAFGMDSLKTLRENPEAAQQVKGITPEVVESIRKHFAEQVEFDPVAYGKLAEMFAGHKIPRKIIKILLAFWGSNAPEMLKEKPYMLMALPRMGWKTVDAFATSAAVEYASDGVDRHKFALVEALTRISSDGHTVATKAEIEAAAFPLVGGLPAEEAWEAAFAEELIAEISGGIFRMAADSLYSLPEIAAAEETIAYRLGLLAEAATPLPFTLNDEGLTDGQREALRLIEQHGVVIVSGPPGTGKTFTITHAMAGLVANGVKSIRFVAPTGKAAKRAAELLARALPGIEIKSTTVHKALGPVPSEEPEGVPSGNSKHGRGRDAFSFSHNEAKPIEASIVVCDESSMLDVCLASDLLKAVAPGTRVIFVGDPNQLPSVGAGSVLRDMIAAGVPTATLTEVRRNCGTIVRACHEILAGNPPTPAKKVNLAAGDNWIHIEIDRPEAIAERIVELHKTTKTFDPVWDMQVISPEKKKAGVGCRHLNKLLSDALNEWKRIHQSEAPAEEQGGFEPDFVCGDKVVRTKNGLCDLMELIDEADDTHVDWTWGDMRYRLVETDIVNGDMGDVVDICTVNGDTYVVVDFVEPHRRCRLPYTNCHLIVAYAMTCHKCQGSGFPYVILPVHDSFFYDTKKCIGTWNREMIYTMFSRPEQLLVTVGPRSAIESAVRRPSLGRRKTRLRELIASRQFDVEIANDLEVTEDAEVNMEEFADV